MLYRGEIKVSFEVDLYDKDPEELSEMIESSLPEWMQVDDIDITDVDYPIVDDYEDRLLEGKI